MSSNGLKIVEAQSNEADALLDAKMLSGIEMDAGARLRGHVRLYMQAKRIAYHAGSDSFMTHTAAGLQKNISKDELADDIYLNLKVGDTTYVHKKILAAIKAVATELRDGVIVEIRKKVCEAPRTPDSTLRAWLREMLREDVSQDEFENCVVIMKQWMWMVQRSLLDMPVTWHVMPIFWDKGGSGKSTSISRFLSPLGSLQRKDTFAVFRDQFSALRMHFSFALFLDEMEQANKTDSSNIKGALGNDVIPGRAMYNDGGRHAKLNASFIASTNTPPPHGIIDSTGARRFYSLECRGAQGKVEGTRREFFNSFDPLEIWCCVDPHSEAPFLERFEPIRKVQEEVNRASSFVENFVRDYCVRDPAAPLLRFGVITNALSDYAKKIQHHGQLPSHSELKLVLEGLGIKCTNPGNVHHAHGLKILLDDIHHPTNAETSG